MVRDTREIEITAGMDKEIGLYCNLFEIPLNLTNLTRVRGKEPSILYDVVDFARGGISQM